MFFHKIDIDNIRDVCYTLYTITKTQSIAEVYIMTTMNYTTLDDKLFELQKVCTRYSNCDPLANWVLFAVDRYISTGRATREFEKRFINYPNDDLLSLVKKCLNGDKSDDGIIKTVKNEIMTGR